VRGTGKVFAYLRKTALEAVRQRGRRRNGWRDIDYAYGIVIFFLRIVYLASARARPVLFGFLIYPLQESDTSTHLVGVNDRVRGNAERRSTKVYRVCGLTPAWSVWS
jgi:hypothetical protein